MGSGNPSFEDVDIKSYENVLSAEKGSDNQKEIQTWLRPWRSVSRETQSRNSRLPSVALDSLQSGPPRPKENTVHDGAQPMQVYACVPWSGMNIVSK